MNLPVAKCGLDHPAYPVHPGSLDQVVVFFTDVLGWEEIVGDRNGGKGWEVRFVRPKNEREYRVQFTDESFQLSRVESIAGIHLGIWFREAEPVAHAVETWANEQGYHPTIEMADSRGFKWFVHIPDLMPFSLEFVSVGDLRV